MIAAGNRGLRYVERIRSPRRLAEIAIGLVG
jgi:hypothetical protein